MRRSRRRGDRPAAWLLWIVDRLRRTPRVAPRLALLERITLAPRQSLALVEAEGRRLLVATSPEGAPSFYALGEKQAGGNDTAGLDEAYRGGFRGSGVGRGEGSDRGHCAAAARSECTPAPVGFDALDDSSLF